jgi:hypothetical protein
MVTTGNDSKKTEFINAGRFYPLLHSIILASRQFYAPSVVTTVQLKALALLQSGSMHAFSCASCNGVREEVLRVISGLGVTAQTVREVTRVHSAEGENFAPFFRFRSRDAEYAWRQCKGYPSEQNAVRVILGCEWGIWLMPGRLIEQSSKDSGLISGFYALMANPSMQCATVARQMDGLMRMTTNDFGKACTLFEAGDHKVVSDDFGRRAVMTLNRLAAAGHSLD